MIYDTFQQKAIDYIKNDRSVIVSAPTGSGKTVIAEFVINDCIKNNKKAIYTSPIKALSNQKYRDFSRAFPGKSGILTGDVRIDPSASILIMTTEIFRNRILSDHHSLKEYSWIIFDEIHYLDDYERGTVWEESLIFLPEHMKILALSATIPNIKPFAEWISKIQDEPVKIVEENTRPVPLHFLYQYQNRLTDDIRDIRTPNAHKHRHKYRNYAKKHHGAKPNRVDTLVKHLHKQDRLPCIYFAFGRRRCEMLADNLYTVDLLTHDEKQKVTGLYKQLCKDYDLMNERSALDMEPLVEKGIAYHHAGMLPTLKEVIEQLFTSRCIKLIFTTETFALGINMPARSVVFDELRKFYGTHYGPLRTRDFYQMAGRAGRRGIDTEGFVYSRINPKFTSQHDLKRIIYGSPEQVKSRFNASYATILNLYDQYQEDLYDIYPRSFHYYQEKKRRHERALQQMRAKVDLLKDIGYIQDRSLTDTGIFASNVYGYELPLTELYKTGIFNDLSETDLGIIITALVFEPRKGSIMPKISKRVKHLRQITGGVIAKIHRMERRHGMISPSKKYHYHLSTAIERWMSGEPFENILKYSDSDEGEIIRYFRMTIQILRELLDTPLDNAIKNKIYRTMDKINRDIVDAETQLRK